MPLFNLFLEPFYLWKYCKVRKGFHENVSRFRRKYSHIFWMVLTTRSTTHIIVELVHICRYSYLSHSGLVDLQDMKISIRYITVCVEYSLTHVRIVANLYQFIKSTIHLHAPTALPSHGGAGAGRLHYQLKQFTIKSINIYELHITYYFF